MCAIWTKRLKGLTFLVTAVVVIGGRCWSATPDPGLDTLTDVIVGHSNKGPYLLSWTEIDPKTISIVVTGRTLGRGDYTIDLAKGMLWFSANLLQDVAARVSYKTTSKSRSTTGTASLPMTFDVFGSKNSNLQVTGVHVQTDPQRPDSGKTIVGLSGDQTWGTSKLTSRVLMSQDNDARRGEEGGNAERSVVNVGAETRVGAFTFKGSYLTAGSKFTGQKEYGIAAGRQQSDFAVHFVPNKRVEAVASFKTTENTAGENKGAASVAQQQKVIVSPTDTTRVSLTHSTAESANTTSGAQRTAETSGVNIEQKIASGTSAAVSLENTTLNSGGKSEGITTRQASVSSKPSDKVDVAAHVTQKSSDVQGDELKTSASVTLKPMDKVAVQASHARTESTTAGLATDTSVSFKASAASNTEVKGAFTEKTAKDRLQYRRDISLTSSPWKYARLSAMFSQKGANEQDDVTKGASLELTPFSHTRFGAGYKYTQAGSQVMTITDYSASSKPVRFMEVSGSYRDRELGQDYAPDSADMRVAIAPFDYFTLRGSYQANPENLKGEIQNYQASTAGVQVKVGSVGLTADLSQKDEYELGQRSEERAFGLEMPAFGRGRLTTGYKTAQYFGGAGRSTNTYLLGYRRDLGSLFNLSLTGYYTRYREGSSLPDNDEYSAEAALGIRF